MSPLSKKLSEISVGYLGLVDQYDLITRPVLSNQKSFEAGFKAALDLPEIKNMIEALKFYVQAREGISNSEIKHDSDYCFYPNHDVALEVLQDWEKFTKEGE